MSTGFLPGDKDSISPMISVADNQVEKRDRSLIDNKDRMLYQQVEILDEDTNQKAESDEGEISANGIENYAKPNSIYNNNTSRTNNNTSNIKEENQDIGIDSELYLSLIHI